MDRLGVYIDFDSFTLLWQDGLGELDGGVSGDGEMG
jgi:hypothetical protein